ncbi:immunoglobulin superfamily DCC subclass member 3-like protein [Camelus ferus]|nr:immunoglobulin superfamily DCC subclass member 3-like protein [Camelus ferus]
MPFKKGSELAFMQEPGNMVAVWERPLVLLPCQVEGKPPVSSSWQRNGLALANDSSATLMPDGSLHLATLPSRRSLPSRALQPRTPDFCILRATLLPGGILHITNVSQADVGTYHCVARNVANTCHSQDAQLTLKDGRSIGVEGIQVLGTGNLMISDVLVQHSSIYVCAANRPGIRIRRTAQGVLLVQGSSAIFTCVAQGVPEPLLVWLKNGKGLSPGNNIRLTHNNSTLMLAELSAKGEAIYQCGLQAVTLSTSAIRVSWEPPTSNGDVIGYVLHLQPVGEPAGPELQEAVGKGTFEHVFSNLEPATAYSIHLWAYSAEGSSQDSVSIHASTMGSTPAALGFSTKVLNATSVQASWELPPQMGPIQGFKLTASCWLPTLRGPCSRLALSVPSSTQIWACLPHTTLLPPEPAALYEIKLQAFSGNGDGSKAGCSCSQDESSSLPGVVVGVHVGLAALIVASSASFWAGDTGFTSQEPKEYGSTQPRLWGLGPLKVTAVRQLP